MIAKDAVRIRMEKDPGNLPIATVRNVQRALED